jgi:DNA modification methylase
VADLVGDGWKVFAGSCLDRLRELPDGSVDAVVTDPPYGLSNTDPAHVSQALVRWVSGERDFIPEGKGFMGKAWDAFVPPPAVWDECLRVLKPGGHLLAFAGSRTFDLMALSIRLAGFEIRDSVAWLYGSGFPKSLDVSKAIDKSQGENRDRQLQFTAWMRLSGLSSAKARDVLFEAGLITEKSNQASHYFAETMGSQPTIATADMFDALRPYLPEVPEEIERLVAERTGIEWTAYKNREVVGSQTQGKLAVAPGQDNDRGAVEFDITAPATPEAQKWQGWGTALKPAFEPVVVARKPLIGTVAENVLAHGTGGLNIDVARIGTEPREMTVTENGFGSNFMDDGWQPSGKTYEKQVQGRWPSNVMLDEFTAGLVDQQSGVSSSKRALMGTMTTEGSHEGYKRASHDGFELIRGYDDTGGASRFFYIAKASKRDRNEGLDELPEVRHSDREKNDGVGGDNPRNRSNDARQNFHPTVKPTDLMRQLVRLVTPPGGLVLDPFTGSGSTGKAAILEGFEFVGVELTEDYLPIIEGRLSHAVKMRADALVEAEAQEAETLF